MYPRTKRYKLFFRSVQRMKKKGLLALCLTSILMVSACGNGGNVAETSKGAITQEEFYQALKETNGQTVLQELIYKKLLSKDFDVTEKVDAQLKEYEAMYGDQLLSLIQQQLKLPTIESFKKRMTIDYMMQAYAMSKVEVTDKELQQAYDEYQPEIRASHILIGTDVENAKKKAEDLKKQLDEGADFATLAKENSTDTGSAENGGDLGFFGKGTMVAEFEDAAFKLNVGEVSDVVKTQYGYHIIKLEEKKEKGTFEEMKAELRDKLAASKLTDELTTQYLKELVDTSDVKILDEDLKNIFSSTVEDTTQNGTTTDDKTNTDDKNTEKENK